MKVNKNKEEALTQERLKELLRYNCNTGKFYWRKKTSPLSRVVIGSEAGNQHHTGYINIRIEGSQHPAHRLAFLYMLNRWPYDQVDHKNGDKSDNDWFNLRDCTNAENSLNQKNNVKTTGVYFRTDRDKWQVYSPSINDTYEYLGYFDTEQEAIDCRMLWESTHPEYVGEDFK